MTPDPPQIRSWAESEQAEFRGLEARIKALEAAGDYDEAQPLYTPVLEILVSTWGPQHASTAVRKCNLARNLVRQGDFATAVPLTREALDIARTMRPKADRFLLRCLSIAAEAQRGNGALEAAAEALRERITLRGARNDGASLDVDLIHDLFQLGDILRADGRRDAARNAFRDMLLGSAGETVLSARYRITALTALATLAPDAEIAALIAHRGSELESALQRAGPDDLEALAAQASAFRYNDSARSEAFYQAIVARMDSLWGPSDPRSRLALAMLADLHRRNGRDEQAQAIDVRIAQLKGDSIVVPPDEGSPAAVLAAAQKLRTKPGADRSRTIRAYRRAIATLRGQNPLPRHELGVALIDLAGLLWRPDTGFAEAAPLYDEALVLRAAEFGPRHPYRLMDLENASRGYASIGQTQKALDASRAALAGAKEAQAILTPDAPESSRRTASAQLAFLAQDFAAYAALHSAGSEARKRELLPEVFVAIQSAYSSAAAAAISATSLRDVASARGGAGQHDRWRRAQNAIESIDKQLATLVTTADPGAPRERLRLFAARQQAESELAAATDALGAAVPGIAALMASEPVTLDRLQGANALLRSDEVLLLINPGGRGSYASTGGGHIIAVTRDDAAWSTIDVRNSDLCKLTTTLIDQLNSPTRLLFAGETRVDANETGEGFWRYDRNIAYVFTKLLLHDAAVRRLALSKRRILLVPQGCLVGLPFAALVLEPPPGGQTGDVDPDALRATRWLGIEHQLVLLPAVATLATQRRIPKPSVPTRSDPFLGMGDAAFRGQPDPPLPPDRYALRGEPRPKLPGAEQLVRSGGASRTLLAELPRLPQTAFEVRDVARALGGSADTQMLQMNATEAQLRSWSKAGKLDDVSVLLVATHGLIAGDFAGSLTEPALALTPGPLAADNPSDAQNDGLITASEIATLRFGARLVFLSACNTSAGGEAGGEGLSGLARSFLFAGAQSLIVTHFPVDDLAGRRLATDLARRLSKDPAMPVAEALHAAMRALWADPSRDADGQSFSHPAAWAPYAVIEAL